MKYIMILEDDLDLAEGIEISLQEEALQFVHCENILEAKKALSQYDFDLLILDVNLPDGSGFDLCQEVRQTSQVPILLLTARDLELDIVRGLEGGADDYITKPFSIMILRARIRALLRRESPKQQQEYIREPFRFFFTNMTFYKEGKLIELSKTEQRILYLLVFNEGQIITRERLMEWVWSEGTQYVEDNALSVGIRRLREKLEEMPTNPQYIKTIYGKGYLWGKLK